MEPGPAKDVTLQTNFFHSNLRIIDRPSTALLNVVCIAYLFSKTVFGATKIAILDAVSRL